MDTKQLESTLESLYNEERHRIVFWFDPEAEFTDEAPVVKPDDVSLLRSDELGALATKIRLEIEDPEGRYLVYSQEAEPEDADDWLLDIRLYSYTFRADRASILLHELGLTRQSMRSHLNERREFLGNKERVAKLQKLIQPDDDELDFDRKIMATLVRADRAEYFVVLQELFRGWTLMDGMLDLNAAPPEWASIEKYGLEESFWQLAQTHFGYVAETPSCRNLLLGLFASDFAHAVGGQNLPAQIKDLSLPATGTNDAVACLAQWRDSNSRGESYDRISMAVAGFLNISEEEARFDKELQDFEIERLAEVMTFLNVEQVIASKLRDRIMAECDTIDAEMVRTMAKRRQEGHWVSVNFDTAGSPVPRKALEASYEAFICAADFFACRNSHQQGFPTANTADMYEKYQSDLYRFDQIYRLFCECADYAEAEGWNLLKPLQEKVEDLYANWFLPTLSLEWGNLLEKEELIKTWRIPDVSKQVDFYDRVRKHTSVRDRRAFVVISDGFRYEAAEELTRAINGTYRLQADLGSMLGVLPSYTALGMASLLPHNSISYSDKIVMVDGQPTTSTADRNKILEAVDGIAIQSSDLLPLSKQKGRELIQGKQVVYVYHNTIDAAGEMGATEGKTFEAVRRAINELHSIVRYIIDQLNGHFVLVTADHGFLFQESPLTPLEKSKLGEKPPGTVLSKKRAVIGKGLPDHADTWHGDMETTAGVTSGEEFLIPKGVNRFHFAGGARYVHGGALLQEICIPVITVRHIKESGKREKTATRGAQVQVLDTNHKITTARHRFQLLQTEAVGDRILPVVIKVAVYDDDVPVTDIQTVTFDSSSDNISDRTKTVVLVLADREYDRKKRYHLVLRDAETGMELSRVPVTIDRAFTDDF